MLLSSDGVRFHGKDLVQTQIPPKDDVKSNINVTNLTASLNTVPVDFWPEGRGLSAPSSLSHPAPNFDSESKCSLCKEKVAAL